MDTVTVKTSELGGMALCYAVCMIEMPHLQWGETIGEHHASKQIVVPELREPDCYSPYMNWAMFGPIIEREKFTLVFRDLGHASYWFSEAKEPYQENRYISGEGPTPLIATMRCYVASKLGGTVQLPKGLAP